MKCRRCRCRVMVFGAGDDFCHSLHGCPPAKPSHKSKRRFFLCAMHADCNEKFMRLSVRRFVRRSSSTFMMSISSFGLSMTGSTRGRTIGQWSYGPAAIRAMGKQALYSQDIPRKLILFLLLCPVISYFSSIDLPGFTARKNRIS